MLFLLEHSVLFSILGLPLFGEKILPQAAASCFQLNMLDFGVLYDNIEKKNPRKSEKACFLSSKDPIREQEDSAVLTRIIGTFKEVVLTKVASNHTK